MKIVFYISNHGYGHASRCIPIINNILEINNNIELIVKSGSEQIDFIKSLIEDKKRVEFFKEDLDVGLILKENSHEIDREKLNLKLVKYMSSWNERIQKEVEFLKDKDVELIVSDIVPWVFEVSKKLNVKSVLISNFIWTDIYKDIIDINILVKYKLMYELAEYVLYYPLSTKSIKNFKNSQSIGFSVRNFNINFTNSIKQQSNMPIVYFSLGRSVDIDIKIDVENLPYYFYYTEGVNLVGKNAFKIEKSTVNTHDYIYASDLVITKAGWSTVAEAICAKKPMLILDRKDNKEDMNTINNLNRNSVINTFQISDLLDKQRLIKLIEETIKLHKNYDSLVDLSKNNSFEIAKKIINIANEGM